MTVVKKVAVTGPESTGKSWLCKELALHYNTSCVPEYAREYINGLQGDYTQADILRIAKGQVEREAHIASGLKKKQIRPLLFCDTELIVTKIWSLHKFNHCHPWILDHIRKNTYDLYLLCDVDLAWVPDPQREHPQLRTYFFDWYKRELEEYGFSFSVISGQGLDRLQNAIEAVNNHFIKI
jgi:NadR type nicotinamide-nucleotide adenylyltransferase